MGLFLSMCGLAAIGIMAGVCSLIFNIINKSRRLENFKVFSIYNTSRIAIGSFLQVHTSGLVAGSHHRV